MKKKIMGIVLLAAMVGTICSCAEKHDVAKPPPPPPPPAAPPR